MKNIRAATISSVRCSAKMKNILLGGGVQKKSLITEFDAAMVAGNGQMVTCSDQIGYL
jgi:hypothetical protein